MKLITIITVLLLICHITGAQPFSKNSHTTTGEVSLDFFTIGSVLTSTLWHSTIMPSYKLGYQYNFITNNKNYHRLKVNIDYFESNTFTLNSVVLDPGEMRVLQLKLNADYIRYLPFTSYLSFLTGCSIIPEYKYFGQVIGPDQVRVLENYLIS